MENSSSPAPPNRKKRLSRKEQRLRKKQKLRAAVKTGEEEASATTSEANQDNNTSSSSSRNNDNTSNVPSLSVSAVEEDYDATYVPTPIPPQQQVTTQQQNGKKGEKSLGKWFPKAIVLKSSSSAAVTTSAKASCSGHEKDDKGAGTSSLSTTDPPRQKKVALVLFYQYVSGDQLWSESRVNHLMMYLSKIGQARGIGGRIRVAPEGVNATVSSIDNDTSSSSAVEILAHFSKDLQRFDKLFHQTHFKYIKDLSPDRHFKDLKILPVKELVFYGLNNEQAPLGKGGTHLVPKEFHSMLAQKETVVVDVRNHYEAAIGRFDGQEQQQQEKEKETKETSSQSSKSSKEEEESSSAAGGAKYIDPKMRKSTDFPGWLQKSETQAQLKDKNVLLYCTGGVRCERASAFLNKQMGDQLKGVYQLKGGIENYLQAFPDGGYWRGKNFVFDKREAIGVDNKDGDGGVVVKQKQNKKINHKNTKKDPLSSTDNNRKDGGIQATCCVCDKPWDRYIGKKKCDTCGVPVLMCDSCMSNQSKNKKNKNNKKRKDEKAATTTTATTTTPLVRCPLCKEQNVTIKADDVLYTNNGVNGTVGDAFNSGGNSNHSDKDKTGGGGGGKAAPSVLKWGGGHAIQKKERRKYQRIPCRFGAECFRKDCFFFHPERTKKKEESCVKVT